MFVASCATYKLVFVLEQSGQRFDAGLQTGVLWFHLATESCDDRHGRVNCVFVDLCAMLTNERQHAVEAARVEQCTRFTSADKLQHLEKHTQTRYNTEE